MSSSERRGPRAADLLALEEEPAGIVHPQAGQRFHELRLAVSRDPGDANDFTGADVKAHVLDARDAAAIADV